MPGKQVKVAGGTTTPERPWVVAMPCGTFYAFAADALASMFTFANGEAITVETVRARARDSVVLWAEVKRRMDGAGAPLDVFAIHKPSKKNEGLGDFQVFTAVNGVADPNTGRVVNGLAFVKMYNMSRFPNVAAPHQLANMRKPVKEIAVPRVAPVAAAGLARQNVEVNEVTAALQTLALQTAEWARGAYGTQIAEPRVVTANVNGANVYATEMNFAVPVLGAVKVDLHAQGVQTVTCGVTALIQGGSKPARWAGEVPFRAEATAGFIKGVIDEATKNEANPNAVVPPAVDTTGAPHAGRGKSLKQGIDEAIKALASREIADLHCETVIDGGYYRLLGKDQNCPIFGAVVATVNRKNNGELERKFEPSGNSFAAQVLKAGYSDAVANKPDVRGLQSAITLGYSNLRKAALKLESDKAKEPAFTHRLLGMGNNEKGVKMFAIEGLKPGSTPIAVTEDQMVSLLDNKRIENATVQRYKGKPLIRLRGGGSIPRIDVTGIPRSPINRAEGVRGETERMYRELISVLGRRGYGNFGPLTIGKGKSDHKPDRDILEGHFSIGTPVGLSVIFNLDRQPWEFCVVGRQASLAGNIWKDMKRARLAAEIIKHVDIASGVLQAGAAPAPTPKPAAPKVAAVEAAPVTDVVIEETPVVETPVVDETPVETLAAGDGPIVDAVDDDFGNVDEAAAGVDVDEVVEPVDAPADEIIEPEVVVEPETVVEPEVVHKVEEGTHGLGDAAALFNELPEMEETAEEVDNAADYEELNAIVTELDNLMTGLDIEQIEVIEWAQTELGDLLARVHVLQDKGLDVKAEADAIDSSIVWLNDEKHKIYAAEQAAAAEAAPVGADTPAADAVDAVVETPPDMFDGLGDTPEAIFQNMPGTIVK
jgi:hypothetical protein